MPLNNLRVLAISCTSLAACSPADRDPQLTLDSEGNTSAGPSTSSSSDPGNSETGDGTPTTTTTGPDPTTTTGPDPTTTDGAETTLITTLEPTTETSDGSSTSDSGDDTGPPAMCFINSDCPTNACLEFRDHDPAAMCVDGPPGGNTRFPGTVLDFTTGAPLPATKVKFIGVLSALTDPQNATPVVAGTSDASGRIDVTSDAPVNEGIGMVAVIGGGPLFLTITGVAAPMAGVYGPMSSNHDLWAVPAATLSEWSGFLMKDPLLADDLPLGVEGGCLGLVRDASGQPLAGQVVQPVNPGSTAQVRYLDADGDGFNAEQTAASGVFVVLGPGLAEKFEVAGSPMTTASAGSAEDAIFVMVLDLP